jgi:DNA-binding transcriptional regulator PaaX
MTKLGVENRDVALTVDELGSRTVTITEDRLIEGLQSKFGITREEATSAILRAVLRGFIQKEYKDLKAIYKLDVSK